MIKPIARKGCTRFQVYGRANGKQVYVGTYDSKREAEQQEQEHEVTQRKIDRGELAPRTDAKRTFGAAVKLWLEALDDSGSRSHEEYKQRIDDHVSPTLERMPLIDVRKSNITALRDELEHKVAAPTVNTIMGALSSAFTWFVDRDWLSANPCRGVKRLKHDTKVFPWLQSTEAITRLLSELRLNIRTVCAVLVGTGMRLDEALHLRWDDIDLEHRIITVHRGRKGTTKSGKARRVPIFDSVLVVLKEMKLARGANVLLFPGRKLGTPLTQATVRIAFKDAAVDAGIAKEMRVHDLRHTFASLFLIDGGDIFKLSRILGHSSVAITERTYAHLKPTAFDTDYQRVAFRMPSDATVLAFAASR